MIGSKDKAIRNALVRVSEGIGTLSREWSRMAVVGRRARRPRGLIDVLMFEAYRCYRSPHIENPKEHM